MLRTLCGLVLLQNRAVYTKEGCIRGCGLRDAPAVVRDEEILLDPAAQKSLLDPRKVTEICARVKF